MNSELENAGKILDSWLMNELMEQNDFPTFNTEYGKAGKALGDNRERPKSSDVKKIVDYVTVNDFSDNVFERVKKNDAASLFPYIGNTFYFAMGKIKRNLIVDYLIKLSHRDDLIEKAYSDKTEIAWFSFSASESGDYIEHSFKLSNLLWSVSTVKKKRAKSQKIVFELDPKIYDEVTERFDKMLIGKKYSAFIAELYEQVYSEYIKYLEIPCDINGVCAIYRYKERREDNDIEEDLTDLGRSYISKDLSLVSSAIKNGSFGKNSAYEKQVLAYITSAVPDRVIGTRIDVSTESPRDKMKEFFCEKLDPLKSPLGKWPSRFMPALMQQTAINLSIDEKHPLPVFSVNGPPGSGKTTLLKEIIAHYIVKRAELLCDTASPDDMFLENKVTQPFGNDTIKYFSIKNNKINDYSIIVTSCNNAAVENITKDLPCQSDVFNGLSHDENDTSNDAKQLDFIKKMFTPEESTDKLRVKTENDKYREIPDLFYTYYVRKLLNNDDNWGLISAPLGKKQNINNYSYNFLRQLYYNNLCKPEEYEKHLRLFTLRCSMFKKQLANVRKIQKELHDFSTAPESRKTGLLSMFKKQHKTLGEYLEEYHEKGEFPTAIDDKLMSDYYNEDDGSNNAPSTKAHTCDPWFTGEYNREREKLFYMGLMVHKEFVLSSQAMRQNVMLLLKIWGGIKNEKPEIQSDTKTKIFTALMQSLFLITPVISTTFDSMQTLMKNAPQSGAFGLLIVDEAGQAPPAKAIGSLFRCRHAMIVGDPKQVEPVVTTETMLISEMVATDVTRPYMKKELSVQQFADSINPYGTMLDDTWVGCPLVVHRRCIDPMYTISNVLSYNGTMKLQTNPPKETIEKYFIYERSGWINVNGSENGGGDHFVEEQGRVVINMLRVRLNNISLKKEELIAMGRKKEADKLKLDLFIISPFKTVKEGVKKLILSSDLESDDIDLKAWARDNIGTVHSFQGKGTDEVIFLLGCDKDATGAVKWVNKNIINVAATRAKYRFYVIGDKELWKKNDAVKELDDKVGLDKLLPDISSNEIENRPAAYKCPNCGGPVKLTKNGYVCLNRINNQNCDMELHWLWGYTLTVDEVTKLLSGQTVSYIHNNKEKTAIPDIKYGNRYGKDVLLWKNKF